MSTTIDIRIKETSQVLADQMNSQHLTIHTLRTAMGDKWPAGVPQVQGLLTASSEYTYRSLLLAAARLGIEVVLIKDGVALEPSVRFEPGVEAPHTCNTCG